MTTRYVPGVSSRISHLTGADACGDRDSAHRDAPLAGSASQRAAPSSVSAHEQGSESRTQVGVVSEVRFGAQERCPSSFRKDVRALKLERPLKQKTRNCHNVIKLDEFAP